MARRTVAGAVPNGNTGGADGRCWAPGPTVPKRNIVRAKARNFSILNGLGRLFAHPTVHLRACVRGRLKKAQVNATPQAWVSCMRGGGPPPAPRASVQYRPYWLSTQHLIAICGDIERRHLKMPSNSVQSKPNLQRGGGSKMGLPERSISGVLDASHVRMAYSSSTIWSNIRSGVQPIVCAIEIHTALRCLIQAVNFSLEV